MQRLHTISLLFTLLLLSSGVQVHGAKVGASAKAQREALGSHHELADSSANQAQATTKTKERRAEAESKAEAGATSPDSLQFFLNNEIVPAIFRINETNFVPSPLLEELVEAITQIEQGSRFRLDSIDVTTASSLDGPEKSNYALALRRSTSFIEYLGAASHIEKERFRGYAVAEDWEYMLSLLKEKHPAYYEKVVELMSRYLQNDAREKAMRADVPLWAYLRRDILPYSRYARIVVRGREVEKPLDSALDTLLVITLEPEPLVVVDSLPEQPLLPDSALSDIFLPAAKEPLYVTLKNNLLHSALLVANLGIELGYKRVSLDLPVCYSPYDMFQSDRKLRLLSLQPDLRYWPQGCGKGHFFGLHSTIAGYNIALPSTERYQDNNTAAWGFGLGWGYATALGKSNWALELNIGAGFVCHHTDIYNNVPNGLKLEHRQGLYWGPTRAALSLSYRFNQKRETK